MRSLLFAIVAVAAPAAASPDRAGGLPAGDGGDVRAALLGWRGPAQAEALAAPVMLDGLSSPFGARLDPLRRTVRRHAGVDVAGPRGTPVRAAGDGTVSRAGRAGSYGNMVEVDHGGGRLTRYAHLSVIAVAAGTTIRQGEILGLMGSTGRSTGNHLHFEVRIDGEAADPLVALRSPAPVATAPVVRFAGWGEPSGDRLPSATIR